MKSYPVITKCFFYCISKLSIIKNLHSFRIKLYSKKIIKVKVLQKIQTNLLKILMEYETQKLGRAELRKLHASAVSFILWPRIGRS